MDYDRFQSFQVGGLRVFYDRHMPRNGLQWLNKDLGYAVVHPQTWEELRLAAGVESDGLTVAVPVDV